MILSNWAPLVAELAVELSLLRSRSARVYIRNDLSCEPVSGHVPMPILVGVFQSVWVHCMLSHTLVAAMSRLCVCVHVSVSVCFESDSPCMCDVSCKLYAQNAYGMPSIAGLPVPAAILSVLRELCTLLSTVLYARNPEEHCTDLLLKHGLV